MAQKTPASCPTSLPKRNAMFYSESVVLQVEDELFRVHKEQLESRSEVFRDMFGLPQNEDTKPRVTYESHPIVLEGVEKSGFVALLKVLYPRGPLEKGFYTNSDPESEMSLSWDLKLDEWLSVYRLATLWMMEDIKGLATGKVNHLVDILKDPIRKIILARQYKREDWLLDAYTTISDSWTDISERDMDVLGKDHTIKLQRLMLHRLSCSESELKIEVLFEDEMTELRQAQGKLPITLVRQDKTINYCKLKRKRISANVRVRSRTKVRHDSDNSDPWQLFD